VWGITARNREQNFALNLLMNPEIDFVTLLGQAGTGKTLLTLAAALTQTWKPSSFPRSSSPASRCQSAKTSASCPAPKRKR
jgi:predicted ribonuclease YlaK